ncbi:MAG TPA: hypothetical protein PKC43_06570 [Phycisphaerales bacterium]|nr:hypothetical protein [Phycisphaerales bacterium]HMP37095.1 hypothetical protein [Phycisphaerales bacterium]
MAVHHELVEAFTTSIAESRFEASAMLVAAYAIGALSFPCDEAEKARERSGAPLEIGSSEFLAAHERKRRAAVLRSLLRSELIWSKAESSETDTIAMVGAFRGNMAWVSYCLEKHPDVVDGPDDHAEQISWAIYALCASGREIDTFLRGGHASSARVPKLGGLNGFEAFVVADDDGGIDFGSWIDIPVADDSKHYSTLELYPRLAMAMMRVHNFRHEGNEQYSGGRARILCVRVEVLGEAGVQPVSIDAVDDALTNAGIGPLFERQASTGQ